jgi:uncharacterized protein YbjT (DUF2867 family)
MILVVGGSGSLGSALTRRLLASGARVRVMTRRPEAAGALRDEGAEVVAGDLLDRASLIRACAGADAVVASAHAMLGRGRQASVHVDLTGHQHLVEAARLNRVGHFVYTSVYDFGPAFQAVPFFRIKLDVEQHLRASGLAHTIVRPTAFMEMHAHELIGAPILANRRVVLFGRGEQPRNFVAVDDVARCIVRVLHDASLAGGVLDVGGPDNLTNMDVVRIYERLGGQRARVSHLPVPALRLASLLARPFYPGLSQVFQAGVLGDTVDQRFDASGLEARLGFPLTRLEDWVSARLARSHQPAV